MKHSCEITTGWVIQHYLLTVDHNIYTRL